MPGPDETAHHLRWGLVTETFAAPSATDSREQLLELIKAHAIVHGKVTLSSGKEADYYVDLRRITLSGQAAPLVGEVMLDLIADLEFDAVGGLTLGADPVAAAMLHAAARRGEQLGRVRRPQGREGPRPPAAHRGPVLAGRRVLAVEDTSTTGGSVLTAVEALARPAPRSWPWRSSSTARAVRRRRSRRRGCPTSRRTASPSWASAEPRWRTRRPGRAGCGPG